MIMCCVLPLVANIAVTLEIPSTCLTQNFVQAPISCLCFSFSPPLFFNTFGGNILESGKRVFWHVHWKYVQSQPFHFLQLCNGLLFSLSLAKSFNEYEKSVCSELNNNKTDNKMDVVLIFKHCAKILTLFFCSFNQIL